jgi:hypothetical protein
VIDLAVIASKWKFYFINSVFEMKFHRSEMECLIYFCCQGAAAPADEKPASE